MALERISCSYELSGELFHPFFFTLVKCRLARHRECDAVGPLRDKLITAKIIRTWALAVALNLITVPCDCLLGRTKKRRIFARHTVFCNSIEGQQRKRR